MNQFAPENAVPLLKAGHLLEPFGWAGSRLTRLIEAKPNLVLDLLQIDCPRMHLIALALAHLNGEAMQNLGEVLIHGPANAVMQLMPTLYPSGIERVLQHLPSSVIRPDSYRRLVELLADNNAANFLQTAEFIDDAVIAALQGLPSPLRNSCLLSALDPLDLEESFSDGLRFLVSHGAASNFDELVSQLASISQVERLHSKIDELVEALPLPTTFPPPQIRQARRIDQPAEIRALAKSWDNCLSDYVNKINAGTCSVYIWEDGTLPAACPVRRYGRLGWFLDRIRGPENASVGPEQLAQIRSAFSQAGIHRYETIAAIFLMSRQAESWGDKQ